MTRSAVTLLFQATTQGALLVMAHPYRYTKKVTSAQRRPREPRMVWQRNGGRGMKSPIPLPPFLCQDRRLSLEPFTAPPKTSYNQAAAGKAAGPPLFQSVTHRHGLPEPHR